MHWAMFGIRRIGIPGLGLTALAVTLALGSAALAQTSPPKVVDFQGPELPALNTGADDGLIVVSDEDEPPPAPPSDASPPAPEQSADSNAPSAASSAQPAATSTQSSSQVRIRVSDGPTVAAPSVETSPSGVQETNDDAQHQADAPPELALIPEASPAPQGPYPEDTPTAAQAASFEGLRPGESTLADATSALGEPVSLQQHNAASATAVFSVEAFDKVRILLNHQVITSIVIEMGQSLDPQSLLVQLGLDKFTPVTVRDDAGRPLGIAVPERGVLLTLSTEGTSASVKQVVLESVDSQTFVERARSDLFGPMTANLADLAKAIELSPDDATAHYLRSELLLRVGRADDALAAASKAIELEGDQPQFRFGYARALAAADRYEQAIHETERVLEQVDLAPVVRAAGFAQLGDLLLEGPRRDVDDALKFHQAALKLAIPLASDADSPDRRAALGIVIDSHLAIAQDISLGNWRNKPQAIDGWTRRAAQFAQRAIQQGDAGADAVLSVSRAALAAHAALRGATDGGAWLADALRAGETLLAEEQDPLKLMDIHWQLAVCNFHALQIAHARGEVTEAEDLGQAAIEQVHEMAELRDLSAPQLHLLGRLFFQIGAVYAVHQQDHREAARWYDKAAELLKTPVAVSWLTQPSDIGEAMISMGVSYWELDRRNEAVSWTEQGAALVARAVRQGAAPEDSLSVPYGNLASMYRQLGDKAQAENYAELAARPAAAIHQ